MRDDDTFEFESGERGSSQLPAVLMAAAAIAAILLVNSTVLAPAVAATARAAPAAPSVTSVPDGEASTPAASALRT